MDHSALVLQGGIMNTTTRTAPDTGAPANDTIEPFVIRVPEADLDDLRERLAHTRAGQSARPSATRARDRRSRSYRPSSCTGLTAMTGGAARRCSTGWASTARQSTASASTSWHIRSAEPEALPLLLTHGWPGSILEFR